MNQQNRTIGIEVKVVGAFYWRQIFALDSAVVKTKKNVLAHMATS